MINEWLYVPLKNFSLIWRRHHCHENTCIRAAKCRPMLGAQGLWAGKDLYHATPVVTWDLGFSGLIRRTAPFSHLLWHTKGCAGSLLPCILTGTMKIHVSSQRHMKIHAGFFTLMIIIDCFYVHVLCNINFAILYTRGSFQKEIKVAWTMFYMYYSKPLPPFQKR
jgi:hypothetical protein